MKTVSLITIAMITKILCFTLLKCGVKMAEFFHRYGVKNGLV
ncbi:hypothetical protein [Rodentibacter caecimuris]|nr:hypothetical protein [Rodentibacter heylii]